MPRHYSASRFNISYGTDKKEGLFGTAGNDIMFGYGGDDLMLGGFGNDYLFGGMGNDFLHGGDGNDFLYGGQGINNLNGGNGNDRLILTDGDIATGGADADVFHFNIARGGDIRITDFDAAEGDMLRLNLRGDTAWEATDAGTHTELAFSTGAVINLYWVTAEEIHDDPGLFGL